MKLLLQARCLTSTDISSALFILLTHTGRFGKEIDDQNRDKPAYVIIEEKKRNIEDCSIFVKDDDEGEIHHDNPKDEEDYP